MTTPPQHVHRTADEIHSLFGPGCTYVAVTRFTPDDEALVLSPVDQNPAETVALLRLAIERLTGRR